MLRQLKTTRHAQVKKEFLHLRKRGAIITVQGRIENEKTPNIGVFLS
jgi:hypothetical protein